MNIVQSCNSHEFGLVTVFVFVSVSLSIYVHLLVWLMGLQVVSQHSCCFRVKP